MDYTTEFDGSVTVDPPLNAAEVAYLKKFNESRRMQRSNGPYFVDGAGDYAPDIENGNFPDPSQPGLWCQWVPSDDGTVIEWDGNEKFYNSEAWMVYLIDHFLKPDARAASVGDPQFTDFTFDHVLNGQIQAEGEDSDDVWLLVVKDNVVSKIEGTLVFSPH